MDRWQFSVVAQTCGLSAEEAETGTLRAPGWPGLHIEIVTNKLNTPPAIDLHRKDACGDVPLDTAGLFVGWTASPVCCYLQGLSIVVGISVRQGGSVHSCRHADPLSRVLANCGPVTNLSVSWSESFPRRAQVRMDQVQGTCWLCSGCSLYPSGSV